MSLHGQVDIDRIYSKINLAVKYIELARAKTLLSTRQPTSLVANAGETAIYDLKNALDALEGPEGALRDAPPF